MYYETPGLFYTTVMPQTGKLVMVSKGSCLCGGVKYEITGEIGEIIHCHCTTCRKAHASAFSSVSAVDKDDIQFTNGEKLLKSFESSPGKNRYFCSNCGSQIFAQRENQEHVIFRLGTLDIMPELKSKEHIWVSLKAPWYDLCEASQLPQFVEWPED